MKELSSAGGLWPAALCLSDHDEPRPVPLGLSLEESDGRRDVRFSENLRRGGEVDVLRRASRVEQLALRIARSIHSLDLDGH